MASFLENFETLHEFVENAKLKLFGENNSRLDYLVDHFYSIRPRKRAKIVFYSIIGSVIAFFLLVFVYFWSLHSLQKQLEDAIADTNVLQTLKAPYTQIQGQFSQITSSLQSSNQPSQIVSALDQKAKSMDIQTSNLSGTPPLIGLPSSHPLAKQFKKARIEFSLSNVSLKKIIEYVRAIQEMPNKYRVTKLDISQIFGTRLYFNVNLIVECYVPSAKT